jgi:tetratricopeptide (TPR) repeat protein
MQPRPDPEVQAAILRTADSPFDLSARLAELVRRYSVVRLEGGARLHDAMGAFMWEYLLATEARASDLLRQIANVALDTLYARRAALELDLPTLADRVESVDWGQTTLDLVLWLFWRDERAAWHELIPRLVEGLGYSHSLVWGLLAASAAFGRALSQDGRRRLKHLVPNPENFGNLLDELEQLANKGWLDEEDVERANERWAVLQFLRGRWLTREGRYEEAQKTYLGAELMLPAGAAELRARLSDAYSDIGWKIGFRLGCHQEAIEAFDRAIELSRDSASAYRGRGNARRLKGDFSGAVSDLKEACQLQPDNVLILVDLAGALIDAGDAERGQQVAQEALSRLSETQVYFKAAMQGLIGNDDIALDLLELCLEADPSQGEWAQKDPDWRRFHSNPKYRALVGLPPLT